MVLQEIGLPPQGPTFPFSLAVLGGTRRIVLDAPVTVLVGENGTGKSTLLEALAYASELPATGSAPSVERDPTLAPARDLGNALRLSWSHRTRRGLFLRAEDYFGFVKAQNRMKAEMRAELERVRRDHPELSDAELRRRQQPFHASIAATEARYRGDLDARSHGESFLAFFKGRLTGEGLYVLDEPEAALSPLSSLAFLALIKDAVGRGAQFVIATHSPILMAFAAARLYELRGPEIVPCSYDELEPVQTLRRFLEAPDAFLRHL
ncbi:MAG: AAA family ATPase [Deinococcales bacterium]